MNLKESQQEMRITFLGGFAGQLVSGLIWLVAAAISVWLQPRAGMAALFFGSMLIFPLTQGTLRLMGYPAKVSPENGYGALAPKPPSPCRSIFCWWARRPCIVKTGFSRRR